MTLKEFILQEMDRRGLSQNGFAELIGIASSSMSRILSAPDDQLPTLEFLIKLAKGTDTDIEILAKIVAPELADLDPAVLLLAQRITQLNLDADVLLTALKIVQLPIEQQRMIQQLIDSLRPKDNDVQ